LNVAKPNEVKDHYESSYYGTGRIIADMSDTSALYISTGTGQSGSVTSKYYYNGGPKYVEGKYDLIIDFN